MPSVKINGARIHYKVAGSGPETIVFAHGLLWDGRMFDDQVAYFGDRYRCVTFDFRGQGETEVTKDGYDMDSLTEDARALIDELDCAPCHFLGLSMGGFVAMRLALRHPALLRSLILMETSADPEPKMTLPKYRRLSFISRWFGFRIVASRVMPIMFGRKLMEDPKRYDLRELWRKRLVSNNRIGTSRAVQGVLEREGVYDQLGNINTSTLIIVGDQDTATIPARSERMNKAIVGSQLVYIEGAGHSSTIEEPMAVNSAIAEFLAGLEGQRNG